MPNVTIRFRHNPKTGQRELVVSFESEPDALPHEHERDHRALVEQVLGRPLTEDDPVIVVERVETGSEAAPAEADAQIAERERLKT